MRPLIYLIICFCLVSGQISAQDEIQINVYKKKVRHQKTVKVKPTLDPQSKKTLSVEAKKEEIINNPEPALYNDIRDYIVDKNAEDQDLDKEETPHEQNVSRTRKDVSSMGSELNDLMKDQNLTIGGKPYSLQGLPILYASKSTGFNLGVRASFANMEFKQPYLYKFMFQYWVSDRGVRNHEVELDIPHFFSKHWHIRFDYKYSVIIDNHYFGIGNDSVFNKALMDPASPDFISRNYYQYKLTYPNFTFDVEYKLFSELFSVYTGIGLEKASLVPYDYDGRSKLYSDKPYGYEGGKTNYIRAGVKLDTRDYPYNPTKGIVLEGTYTDHAKFLDSDFHYYNIDITYMWFFSFFRYFTVGHRIIVDQIMGNAPFFALAEFKSYTSYQGLGGSDILRGATTFRFIDNLKFINQLELRTRFYNGVVFGQHLQINVNPFWDIGRVWNVKKQMRFIGFHNSFGSEFRFTWNANFIASFTIGISKETTSTYLSFGESFN